MSLYLINLQKLTAIVNNDKIDCTLHLAEVEAKLIEHDLGDLIAEVLHKSLIDKQIVSAKYSREIINELCYLLDNTL